MSLIEHEAHRPNPATSDLSPYITNARCTGIPQCSSVDVSASQVTDVSDASIDNVGSFMTRVYSCKAKLLFSQHTTLVREEGSCRQASSDMSDAGQRTASGDITHSTPEEDLRPPNWTSPYTATPQPSFRVSTLVSTCRYIDLYVLILPCDKLPLNVLLFGETGVDKSSIIQLIVGQNIVDAVPGGPYSMLKRTAGVTLGERRFELWEVSSSIALMGFFRRFFAKLKRRLRASYKRLHRDGGAPLVLYCMKGTSTPTASREYQHFTDIVGSTSCVSISAVVDGLEESLTNMDDWWTTYKGDLIRLGMQFSNHVCITLLPDDPNALRSRETIRNLIESYALYVPRHTS